jgi:hypothetical protein
LVTSSIPVTVVAGASRSGKSHLLAQLRAARPPAQRWAFLSNSVEAGSQDVPGGPVPAEGYFHVAGGCACCIAGPAFRTTLVRLLRAGPWHRLQIEVDPAGHPHSLVDQLRTPPFDRYLTVTQLLLTLRESDSALYQSGSDLLGPGGRLGFATDFLLRTEPSADPANAFGTRLESAAPWPRLERIAGRRLARTDSGLPADLPGWRIFSALAPAQTPENFSIIRQWPAQTVAQRRPFKDLLSALASDAGITGFQALMRTPRAWYRWTFGRGGGAGPLAFDEGQRIVEAETTWRFDNRICLWLASGPRRQAVAARLQGLDRALQGPEGLLDPAVSQAAPGSGFP